MTSSHSNANSNRAAFRTAADSDIPISCFAPGVGEMPVIQQYIDASIGTLYCIYWIIVYQDFSTQLPATRAEQVFIVSSKVSSSHRKQGK